MGQARQILISPRALMKVANVVEVELELEHISAELNRGFPKVFG